MGTHTNTRQTQMYIYIYINIYIYICISRIHVCIYYICEQPCLSLYIYICPTRYSATLMQAIFAHNYKHVHVISLSISRALSQYIYIYIYVQLVHADDILAIVQHSCKRYSLMIANMCMCVFVAIICQ